MAGFQTTGGTGDAEAAAPQPATPRPATPPSAAPNAYLLLDLAGTACALPAAAAGEILPLPDLAAAPAAGGWLAGFLNLGGAAVPVVDLARLTGLRADEPAPPGLYAHLVLARDGGLAWLCDRVADLVRAGPGELRPAAEGDSLNGCVAATLARGESLIPVLDPDRLLTAAEGARLEALTRAASRRLAALPAA